MPKGEKPKGPTLVPTAEAARQLRVDQSQVEAWIRKGLLRGADTGIKPYDFNKFQLDQAEEIKRAQKEAHQGKQTKSDRKPKKGFLSKFTSIFGGGKDSGEEDPQKLARENQKLQAELRKLRKAKPNKDSSPNRETEEKIRYLENKASEAGALKVEIAKLKQRLKEKPEPAPAAQPNDDLLRELEQARQELELAKEASAERERVQRALAQTQTERDALQARLVELEASSSQAQASSQEVQHLQAALQAREKALAALQAQTHEMVEENERLRSEVEAVPIAPTQQEQPEDPLTAELLDLQKVNLERFRRLRTLYLEAAEKIEVLQSSAPQESEPSAEFEELSRKYKKLLTTQSSENPAHQEVLEQLSNSRVTVAKLKEENARLRNQLSRPDKRDTEARIAELQAKLDEAKAKSDQYKLVESELSGLKKGLQVKENQIQKVASRLADNEKRLAKALQESARLTELLIERENRLRELSKEFEQEYRDKMENLDRQVSGLQWKLSLREERIAHLESELLRKGQ